VVTAALLLSALAAGIWAAAKCALFDAAVTSPAPDWPALRDVGSAAAAARPNIPWLGTACVTAGAGAAGGPARVSESWRVVIGIVEITREAGFGGTILTGCSSRETSFSIDPVVTVSTWPAFAAFLACGSLAAGAILVGSLTHARRQARGEPIYNYGS
jgi:hypothetical protein